VPEAIAGLRQAGIKVWVLTGDKQVRKHSIYCTSVTTPTQETAINVGYSSQLFDEVMDIIIINSSSEVIWYCGFISDFLAVWELLFDIT